ncbi:hypothetical protein BD847_2120 [Flavobacterium cutihirudinis]|uniref:Uncharacterized protein n=1 Tax=Flavobacterium cutihirudinis TaxID=1265740 RepID=A0A3D9FX99_9FLAO|nr:hypothetical protein [Flavobacterium cutihirudinis]RED25370.1 hypothetical protein BD847_2120 [Flavobacterium cutihirudinis]
MRKCIWSLLLVFSGIFISFSQSKNIEKGTYLSTNKGEKIKLNLLDNNKYELVFYSGEYEIKGDSLLFAEKEKSENNFDLVFTTNKKAKNIKINFKDPSYYLLYIGTQKGKEEVQYQRLSDIKTKVDPDYAKTDVEFEIEKTDYLYLVYEEYTGETTVCKYALPKDISEVKIEFEPAVMGSLKISGFFDKKTNQLTISEQSGKNPLVFTNEKNPQPENKSKVAALESQIVQNWTYPGKETGLETEGWGSAVAADSTATPLYPVDSSYVKYDFKLKIENNLKKAIDVTKEAKNKFLVIAVDTKNTTDFDTYIKDQETQIGYNMYDAYNPQYDVFNFYKAGKDDKKWLKANNIKTDPSTLIVNGNGDLLAISNSGIGDKQYQFSYYGDIYRKLLRTDAFVSIEKIFKNKKVIDSDLIRGFNKAAVLEPNYDDDLEYSLTDLNSTEFTMNKPVLDKKSVSQSWKKLIEAHQKDAVPNLYLVETILKEIKNQGFTKQLFNEERVLNDTDFLSIDYLLKHSVAIEEQRAGFNNKEGEIHTMGNVITEISAALQQNLYVSQEGVSGEANKERVNTIYKKIIATGKGNFEAYRNYFAYLGKSQDQEGYNSTFLKEFSTYFDANLVAASPIEKLDEMYSGLDTKSDYAYDGWNLFKEYHSNLCNSAAWSVVLKAENASFLKEALKWSEYSLIVTKNNPYYLDTLAQLYYKDGQKEKAISTQTLAVKYLDATIDEDTAQDIKEVLAKMQNGTY